MTAPAVRRPLSSTDLAILVFAAVVLLLMLATSESRDWMWATFTDLTLDAIGLLGVDVGPLTL